MLLFSAAGLTEPKLCVQRFKSEQYSMLHVQRTLKKRKTRRLLRETKARPGGQEIRKECIVKERAPTASSTLREEERTAMSKLVEAMTPLCSMDGVYL